MNVEKGNVRKKVHGMTVKTATKAGFEAAAKDAALLNVKMQPWTLSY